MIKNNKIVLLFPDGVGIRNYLFTNVFKELEEEIVLFHAFDSKTEEEIKKITSIEESYPIPKYKESLKEKFLRELICLSRLKSNAALEQNPTILKSWKTNHKGFTKKLFYFLITTCTLFVSKYSQIIWLEKQYQKAIRKTAYYDTVYSFLQNLKPAKLFCSHQRGVQCAPIFAAAQDLKIQTITVVYSWDNLPKARMALRADKYLVWSPYMENELLLYYPEIKKEQIFVTGTPQFECYSKSENIIPKEEFYQKYNLDSTKKIICYSGDDVLTCPDDPQYLEDVAKELIANKLDMEYQILLRRCPVDISGRFNAVIDTYPNLIKQAPPLWNFEPNSNWTTVYPLPDDVKLLVSTAYYSDIVVNLGSTMAFDFAMFNKPCVYINYDQENKVNPNWSVKTIYKYQHFRSMPSKEAVLWWNKKEDLKNIIAEKLNTDAMENWKSIILSDYFNVSEKIINKLK